MKHKYSLIFTKVWISIILLLIIIIGIIIRVAPFQTKYPIGNDAGQYYSLAAVCAETWPLLPGKLPFFGGMDLSQSPPLLSSWLVAAISKLPGLDVFSSMWLYTFLIFILTVISVYLLAKEITNKPIIGLISAFLYSTDRLDLFVTYGENLQRTQLGLLFITLFSLFLIKAIKSNDHQPKLFSRKETVYSLVSGIFIALVMASHIDLSTFVIITMCLIIMIIYLVLMRKNSRSIICSTIKAMVFGGIIGLPVLITHHNFIFERLLRLHATTNSGGNLRESMLATLTTLPVPHFGYATIIFGIIGIFVILKYKREQVSFLLLFAWLILSVTLSYAYLGGIFFFNFRFMSYVVIPLSISAGIGISYIVTELVNNNRYKTILSLLLILIIVPTQIIDASKALSSDPDARAFLNSDREEALLWIKSNTPKDAVIFSTLDPYAFQNYIPGVSERSVSWPPENYISPSDTLEYIQGLTALEMITLNNPLSVASILQQYPHSYIISVNGFPFDAETRQRYTKYYEKVFENQEMVLYSTNTLRIIPIITGRVNLLTSDNVDNPELVLFDQERSTLTHISAWEAMVTYNGVSKRMFVPLDSGAQGWFTSTDEKKVSLNTADERTILKISWINPSSDPSEMGYILEWDKNSIDVKISIFVKVKTPEFLGTGSYGLFNDPRTWDNILLPEGQVLKNDKETEFTTKYDGISYNGKSGQVIFINTTKQTGLGVDFPNQLIEISNSFKYQVTRFTVANPYLVDDYFAYPVLSMEFLYNVVLPENTIKNRD